MPLSTRRTSSGMGADRGDHWLFIRGLARESSHWEGFAQAFKESTPGVAVHLIDLPGTGRHWKRKSPWSLEQITDAVRDDARAQGVSVDAGRGCFALAMSLGAMVVVDWLCRFPNELAGAVLINTSAGDLCPFWKRLRPSAWLPLLKIVLTSEPRVREEMVLKLTTNLKEVDDALLVRHEAVQRERPVSRENLLRQIVAASRFSMNGAMPTAPILLLRSACDRLVDPDCSLQLRQAWQAVLQTHPTANHDLPFDEPLWTIREIHAWREALNGPRRSIPG